MFSGVSRRFNWVYFESFKTGTIGCFVDPKRAGVIVFVCRGSGNIHLIIQLYNHPKYRATRRPYMRRTKTKVEMARLATTSNEISPRAHLGAD